MSTHTFDRKIPLLIFAATSVLLLGHHFYAVSEGQVFVFVVFVVPVFWALGLAGLVHPPLAFVIGQYGRDLPLPTKLIGYVVALAGLAAGFLLATRVYGFSL